MAAINAKAGDAARGKIHTSSGDQKPSLMTASASPPVECLERSAHHFSFSSDIAHAVSLDGVLLSMQSSGAAFRPKPLFGGRFAAALLEALVRVLDVGLDHRPLRLGSRIGEPLLLALQLLAELLAIRVALAAALLEALLRVLDVGLDHRPLRLASRLGEPLLWRFSFLRSFLHFGCSPAVGVGLGGVGFAV